ncbi:DoxX family membrane protein [Cytophagaceae bacterium YF14B1]|uniref:DoxX family membrane protein n=1 Tax=Xanthocytophaga flava TaxID=3048013 RepID=A0AAE3UB20_9BACT|nr:BT_3928 family protein [Xanthocytophaga flavus]MDJ1485327.1 DoxX family membrane protein [Xanthocytophaga flavus]
MKLINNLIRIFVGVLFIFSGLIKLNDPVGTKIKLEEYFEVFAEDLLWAAGLFHFLIPMALVLAVVLCVLEVVLGIALLLRYRLKSTVWVLLGIIVFFTFLTFYSAYFNKVTDCGCFGDAIKLSPWQSFGKDILLLVLILVLFFQRNKLESNASRQTRMYVVIATIFCTLIGIYAIFYLPPIDFLPYKVGDNIEENMKLPPGAQSDVFEITYTLKNSKSGESKEMTDKEYISTEIWKDTTWQIAKTSEPRLVVKGVRPKITDFSVTTPEGEDITAQIFKGNKLVIVIRDIRSASESELKKISALIQEVKGKPVEPMILTATDGTVMEEYRHEYQLAAPFFFTDNTVLKTMVRTDPGILLLKNGTVTGKWGDSSIPDVEKLKY